MKAKLFDHMVEKPIIIQMHANFSKYSKGPPFWYCHYNEPLRHDAVHPDGYWITENNRVDLNGGKRCDVVLLP